MKILVYGHRGWIATQWIEYVTIHRPEWILVFSNSRADDKIAVSQDIKNVQPDRIVVMIGRTHGLGHSTIDYLESPDRLRENINDNLFGPLQVALLALSLDIHVTYLGTGCIFDGFDHSFTDDETPNFFGSQYSTVKGFTDRLMHLLSNVLNLRIRMPITYRDHPRNFISKIIRYPNVCSIPNSMTVLDDFFPIFTDLIDRKYTGTLNCTNPGAISHEEILQMYQEIVDKNFTYHLCNPQELSNHIIAKRSNNVLDTKKLEGMYRIPSIHESVRQSLGRWSA